MNIKQLKKETGLKNKDFARFFRLSEGGFNQSSAKKRYEQALCEFYEHMSVYVKKNN